VEVEVEKWEEGGAQRGAKRIEEKFIEVGSVS
jgi:hypothetical protein